MVSEERFRAYERTGVLPPADEGLAAAPEEKPAADDDAETASSSATSDER